MAIERSTIAVTGADRSFPDAPDVREEERNVKRSLIWFRFILPAALAAQAGAGALAASPACTARSPAHRVALLELYTSEGCSSCPPADRWLGSLRQAPALAAKVLPLALHVDYWDDIGWKDRFAQPAFATRQRELAGGTVYTPQFFLQGRSWRPAAADNALAEAVRGLSRQPAAADITLTLGPATEGRLPVHVLARLRPGQEAAGLHLVLYQNGLSSEVRAGENRGATLHHDYLVRSWLGPRPLQAGQTLDETLSLLIPADAPVRDLGVAAFIEDARRRDVLQALALPACG